jgi:hypothetical protein
MTVKDDSITVTFVDRGRTAKCPPDPMFPHGKDIDASHKSKHACTAQIPYPAPRCGLMVVHCSKCDQSVALTVAGRVDDPRSLKMACRLGGRVLQ